MITYTDALAALTAAGIAREDAPNTYGEGEREYVNDPAAPGNDARADAFIRTALEGWLHASGVYVRQDADPTPSPERLPHLATVVVPEGLNYGGAPDRSYTAENYAPGLALAQAVLAAGLIPAPLISE